MSFAKDVLGFEGFNLKNIGKKVSENPLRLLYGGIDPASTKAWNKVLGRDDEPLIDQWGGASKDTYAKAESAGINTGPGKTMHDIAKVAVALVAGGYGADQAGAAAGGGGVEGGSTVGAGETGSEVVADEGVAGGSGGGSSWMDFVKKFGTGGGGQSNQAKPKAQNELRTYDADVKAGDNDFLAQYNANQGAYNDGHRIEIKGDQAYLYDGKDQLIGRAPAGEGLYEAIRSMNDEG